MRAVLIALCLFLFPSPLSSYAQEHEGARDWLDQRIDQLAICESGGNPYAIGQGRYLGYLQFEPRTWEETKHRMGAPELNIWSAEDQHAAARWLILNGEAWRWSTCWRRTG